jgi:two-component system, sensor histidine kinase
MDHIMPNLEGPAATKQIRDLGYKGLVIGLTGQLQPEEQQLFKEQGANHVLAKPVDLTILRGILEACVSNKM